MYEPVPRGFRIVGVLMMLAFTGCALLPAVIFMGGGRYVVASVWVVAEFLYDWGAVIFGVLVAAGTILLIVRWANRRPPAP